MRVAAIFALVFALTGCAFTQRDSGRQPEKADASMEDEKAVETGTVEIKVVEEVTGETVPARVLIRDGNGKSYKPDNSVPAWTLGDKWFMCPGESAVSVPPGEITIRVERGKEYEAIRQTLSIAEGETRMVQVDLIRWIDMRSMGYSNGDNHLHIKYEWLAGMLAGEDLDFGSTLQWWTRPMPEMGIPDEGGALRDLEFGGASVPVNVFDAEWENAFGAIYAIGLPAPLEMQGDKKRSALPYAKKVREMGALVCYQAGWSAEVLVDSLLGYIDVVNVCNNMFHRHRFLPRTVYMNALGIENWTVFEPTDEGMFKLNTESYYRLLNCGLKLAAGAGSATPVKTNPAGYNRAYVRAGENPTYPQFLQAWREGRNIVTNGPMVFLTVNDTLRPGDSLDLGADGGKVSVKIKAVSDQPLTAVEVVMNGEVCAKASLAPDQKSAELETELDIVEGSWIAARAIDDDQMLDEIEIENYKKTFKEPKPSAEMLKAMKSEDPEKAKKALKALAEKKAKQAEGMLKALTSMRYGHTSPVYVDVAGKGARVEKSIAEARAMLDAFEPFVLKNAKKEYQPEILEGLAAARKKFEAMVSD